MAEFTPNDRFFDQLVAFIASHIGVSLALVIQRRQAMPRLEGKLGGIAATAAGLTIWYEIFPIFQMLESGGWPTSIRYSEEKIPKPSELPREVLRGTGRVHALAAQGMYVQYIDRIETELNRRRHDPIVQFAIKVRNFAAHGGRINIHPSATPVTLRSVTWTAEHDQKPLLTGDVVAPGGSLSAGDLIVLMRDLDAAI